MYRAAAGTAASGRIHCEFSTALGYDDLRINPREAPVNIDKTFSALEPFTSFSGYAFDENFYTDIPPDWLVVTADIENSTQAVSAGQYEAVNYVGVGTIEFLMDADLNFYFLEMNTRLQVEHPVTELVYGVDLVKEQFKAAMGEVLTWDQAAIAPSGWAMECRVNAEDAFANFIPSTGQLTHVSIPTGTGVRVDTGIAAGSAITPYYDSMISKLISYGANREEARRRMLRALDEYSITGVITNIPFHRHMLRHGNFVTGDFHTKFVETAFTMDDYAQEHQLEAAIAAALAQHSQQPAAQNGGQQVVRSGWKNFGR